MRQTSPAADRNKDPILAVLRRVLPASGQAMEVAAGTGQHAVHFARNLPGWTWWPTDPSAVARASIAAWAEAAALPNLQPPQPFDLLTDAWPVPGPLDAVYAANLLHISPWACCAALMQGSARALAPQGRLIVYGPFVVPGEPTAASNLAFDADLRQRDAAWGLRGLDAVTAQAQHAGLALLERVPMPANNLLLVFGPAPP